MKNAIVGQSGGPSTVINSSLAGVIAACKQNKDIGKIYGMKHGIEGFLKEEIIDFDFADDETIKKLKASPAMALGSCRYKLPEKGESIKDYEKAKELFKKYNIGYFFYIGGNDSMDTILKLHEFFEDSGIHFVGVPKTIDNDLCITDHTPGFGSAAKYLATTMSELITDTSIYDVKSVTIVEIMGRNSGWLTLAASMPKILGGDKPDFTYLPEVPFNEEKFISDVKQKLQTENSIIIAVSEGIKDESGEYVGSSTKSGATDIFGHKYLSGVGKYMEHLVREKIGCKVRSIEINLMQRAAMHLSSLCDITEAYDVGFKAVEIAKTESGVMAVILRTGNNPYTYKIGFEKIEKIADKEKLVPKEWCNLNDLKVKEEIKEYILPLMKGNPELYYNENEMPCHISFIKNK